MNITDIVYELEENVEDINHYYPSKKEKLWMIVELIDYVKKNHEKNSILCMRKIVYILRNYVKYLEKNFSVDDVSIVFDNLEILYELLNT
jgi:uncharacterized protein YeeX (DUF496 family)